MLSLAGLTTQGGISMNEGRELIVISSHHAAPPRSDTLRDGNSWNASCELCVLLDNLIHGYARAIPCDWAYGICDGRLIYLCITVLSAQVAHVLIQHRIESLVAARSSPPILAVLLPDLAL